MTAEGTQGTKERMRALVGYGWPVASAVVLLAALVARLLVASLARNDGHLVYAIDDAFIHMAIAKNLVNHGVWGPTPHGFASASSSLLWPLLVAAVYVLTGPVVWAPLVLSFLSACGALAAGHGWLARNGVPPRMRAAALVAAAVLTPLPTLVMEGMEHTLQLAVDILFMAAAAEALTTPSEEPWPRRTLALAALVTAVRYEGALLVAAAMLLLVLRARWRTAIRVGLVGAAPPVLFGLLSVRLGGLFIPNSVLVKTLAPHLGSLGGWYDYFVGIPMKKLLFVPHVYVPLVLAIAVWFARFARSGRQWNARGIPLLLFVILTYAHMVWAAITWFYRYEAYLVALGLLVLLIAAHDVLPSRLPRPLSRSAVAIVVAVVLGVVAFEPLVERAEHAWRDTPQATHNMYEVTYQAGLFLNAFYAGRAVAMNDIGAPNYLGDFDFVDLWGLGSNEVAKARLSGHYDTQRIRDVTQSHGVRVAIVFEGWYGDFGGLPPEWFRAGQWRIVNNVASGGDTYSIFAVDPGEHDALIAHLREFGNRMPGDIVQTGPYTEPTPSS